MLFLRKVAKSISAFFELSPLGIRCCQSIINDLDPPLNLSVPRGNTVYLLLKNRIPSGMAIYCKTVNNCGEDYAGMQWNLFSF